MWKSQNKTLKCEKNKNSLSNQRKCLNVPVVIGVAISYPFCHIQYTDNDLTYFCACCW